MFVNKKEEKMKQERLEKWKSKKKMKLVKRK